MRALLPGDLDMAVRALLNVPPEARAELANLLLQEAQAADLYRRKYGKPHVNFGSGTLASAASTRRLAPLPDHCTAAYCDALALFLEVYLARKSSL